MYALVIESVRINGQPRQRHIASLGGIYERDIGAVSARCGFWDYALRKLDNLSSLTAEDRQRIEKALAKKVPCPTRCEYDQSHAERVALFGAKWMLPTLKRWPDNLAATKARTGAGRGSTSRS